MRFAALLLLATPLVRAEVGHVGALILRAPPPAAVRSEASLPGFIKETLGGMKLIEDKEARLCLRPEFRAGPMAVLALRY